MAELIDTLLAFLATSPYAQYASIFVMICYVITHIVAFLPESVTSKIPDKLMWAISRIAGNYKNSENLKTDQKGNSR